MAHMSAVRMHLATPTAAARAGARPSLAQRGAAASKALRAAPPAGAGAARRGGARVVTVRAGFEDQDPKAAQVAAMKAQYDEAMKDPAQAAQIKAMQEAMADPAVKEQMAGMAQFMQDKEMQEKIKGLQNDPEFEEFFREMKEKGPQALMKYWNDPEMLNKMMQKIGPSSVPMPGGAAPEAPEINNLVDAAKFGDLEAVEDFIAIGKDVNEGDELGRTPLHFAVAYDHTEICSELIANSANLNPVDTKNNTPLHYGAGYGREASMKILIDAGADVTVKNDTGKTAADLAGLDERNPVGQNKELMARLSA